MEKLASQKIKDLRNRPWPKNWVLKLISFCFALFLWYFVVGEDKVDMTISIPVEIVNLPADLTISNQFKRELELTVNGPRGLVRNLSQQHISRPIDLAKAEPGPMVIKNTSDSISLPRGVRLIRVRPTDIILQMDRQLEKNIPIRASTTGSPPSGFELVSVTLEPSSIPVSGPQTVIGNERSFSTEPIDISGLTQSTRITVALQLTQAIHDLVGEPLVTADIVIQEKKSEKTVSGIPIRLLLSGKNPYTLFPETVTVKAKIPLSVLNATEDLKSLFTSRVLARDLQPGKHTLNIEVISENNIEITNIMPQNVVAEIQGIKEERP